MRSVVSLLLSVSLTGCWWYAPPNDAGDATWVRQVIPALLGRNAKNSAEVDALVNIAQRHGRSAVVALLFEEEAFAPYWAQVLADALKVHRRGPYRPRDGCFGPPTLHPSQHDDLIHHVTTESVTAPFCVPPQIIPPRVVLDLEQAEAKLFADDPIGEPMTLAPPLEDEVAELMAAPDPALDILLDGWLPENRTWRFPEGSDLSDDFDGQLVECRSFNMTDLLHAAVREDGMDALMIGYLPVFSSFGQALASPIVHGEMFRSVYLDRSPDCLSCHTTTYSTTNQRPNNNDWDRFTPASSTLPNVIDFEGGAFSGMTHYGGNGELQTTVINNFFRPDVHVTHGGMRPWGFAEECVTNPVSRFTNDMTHGGFASRVTEQRHANGHVLWHATFSGMGPSTTLSVLDLVDTLQDGTQTLGRFQLQAPTTYRLQRQTDAAGNVTYDPVANGKDLVTDATLADSCAGCHPGYNGAPDLSLVVPTLTDQKLYAIMRDGSLKMRPLSWNDRERREVIAYFRDTYGEPNIRALDDPNHAYASLVAMALVNDVWTEVMGHPIVLEHGFPRNPEQALVLEGLTVELTQRWSLKDLLTNIVLSEAFSRRSPSMSPAGTGYALPMVHDPLAAVPHTPTQPEEDANSEGDGVARRSVPSVLLAVHHALGWPAPQILADQSRYPTQTLQTQLGRFESLSRPGVDEVAFDTFLTWESEVASCEKPDIVDAGDVRLNTGHPGRPGDPVGPDAWEDYIDHLMARSSYLSLEEAARAIKDRLLTDQALSATERTRLEDLFGADLGDPLTGYEDELRAYCGVLLTSPRFLLRNLDHQTWEPPMVEDCWEPDCFPLETIDPDEWPAGPFIWAVDLCPKDEPCTEADFCDHYATTARWLMADWRCE
ncbi:MAG: hypothetical protein AAFV53_27885 [Myxococcota bacterium]